MQKIPRAIKQIHLVPKWVGVALCSYDHYGLQSWLLYKTHEQAVTWTNLKDLPMLHFFVSIFIFLHTFYEDLHFLSQIQ